MKKFSFALIIFACLNLVSCKSETNVNGEIFAATTSGTGTYKFSGVPVGVLAEKEGTEFLASKKADYDSKHKAANDLDAKCNELSSLANQVPDDDGSGQIKALREVKICLTQSLEIARAIAEVYTGNPPFVFETKTDAEGKFNLKLSTTGKYLLIARASRDNNPYQWMMWVNADGKPKNLSLTTDNTISKSMPPVNAN